MMQSEQDLNTTGGWVEWKLTPEQEEENYRLLVEELAKPVHAEAMTKWRTDNIALWDQTILEWMWSDWANLNRN